MLQRVDEFTMRITWAMLILITIIFIITVARGDDISTVFLLGVALAVSAIPEGLPVAITIALAIGMKRMAAEGVIIRKLVAVESLGSCTYIASDKTGTLTVNELTVRQIVLANGDTYTVSGEGMDMHGVLSPSQMDESDQQALQLLFTGGVLANEANLKYESGNYVASGDHVDVAFLVLMNKFGIGYEKARAQFTQLGSIPYESQKSYAASVNHYQGKIELFVKGSVEQLLSRCGYAGNDNEFGKIEHRAERLAATGFRVLGVAHRTLDNIPNNPESEMHDLNFIGMVAMIDPLRPEVIDAVKQCRNADIQVAMITGDHPLTANVLAKELGISRLGVTRTMDEPVTGSQLKVAEQTSEDEFDELVSSTHVFARVEPHQKMQIVESLIKKGEFVCLIGEI